MRGYEHPHQRHPVPQRSFLSATPKVLLLPTHLLVNASSISSSPHLFSSPLVGVLSFPYLLAFYKRGWRQQSDHELTKVNRMRTVLMNHLDDLHDIWEACSHMPARVTQEQFSRHLRRELPEMRLSRDVEEFLFEQVKSTQAATS